MFIVLFCITYIAMAISKIFVVKFKSVKNVDQITNLKNQLRIWDLGLISLVTVINTNVLIIICLVLNSQSQPF